MARCLTSGDRYDGETESVSQSSARLFSWKAVTKSYAGSLTRPGGKPGQNMPAARPSRGVRRLTPRECERLQGFPDDWTLINGATDSKRYAALGNAVTVNVVEWIARRLVMIEERYA